jgi:hypothetical protein
MSIVESISQRPFNALPKKGDKSDAPTGGHGFLERERMHSAAKRKKGRRDAEKYSRKGIGHRVVRSFD